MSNFINIPKSSVHIYPCNFQFENRTLKIGISELKEGLVEKVILIGKSNAGNESKKRINFPKDFQCILINTFINSNNRFIRYLSLLEWNIRVIFVITKINKLKIVHAHGLVSTIVGIFVKLFLKKLVIYETHELETFRTGWSFGETIIMKFLENTFVKVCDSVVTVSQPIYNYYKKKFPKEKIFLIRNIPYPFKLKNKKINIRSLAGCKKDDLCLVAVGLIGYGRGVEECIEEFGNQNKIVFVFLGPFESKEYKRKVIKLSKSYSNIKFLPPVKISEVVAFIKNADIGIYNVKPVSKSYQITIGNKFFEYIFAGLPILSWEIGEVSDICIENKLGIVVKNKKGSMLSAIRKLTKKDINIFTKRINNYRESIDWFNEVKPFLDFCKKEIY